MMNRTSEIYYSLLQDIQTKHFGLDEVICRKYTCTNGIGLIYSISFRERMRALAISADKIIDEEYFPLWKGIRIAFVTLPEYDDPSQQYITLQQMPETEAYIFEIVIEDLRRTMEMLPSYDKMVDTVLNVLKKWKIFFSKGQMPILTKRESQGLYGELLFLRELVHHLGFNSVNNWYSGHNTHDFYIGQHAVEVKTSAKQAPYYAHINSEYQLDDSDVNGSLYLKMYALRIDECGGQRLPEIINDIRNLLNSDSAALAMFNKKLKAAGYLDAAEDYYKDGYTIRDTYLFDVKPGFPRLIKADLPDGIYHIEYDVSISEGLKYAVEANEIFRKLEEL